MFLLNTFFYLYYSTYIFLIDFNRHDNTTELYTKITIFIHIFLVLLILASQRIESLLGMWLDDPESITKSKYPDDEEPTKRGEPPSLVEMMILGWVSGEFTISMYICQIYECYFHILIYFLILYKQNPTFSVGEISSVWKFGPVLQVNLFFLSKPASL